CTADTCTETAMACYHSETCAVISEVNVDAATSRAAIEFTNVGAALRDLAGYRIEAAGAMYSLPGGATARIAPAGTLVVRWNTPVAGCPPTDVCTGVFTPSSMIVQATGSIALFAATGALDASTIRDYVEWGTSGQPNEANAATASEWTAGTACSVSMWVAGATDSLAWTGASSMSTNDAVANWCIQPAS